MFIIGYYLLQIVLLTGLDVMVFDACLQYMYVMVFSTAWIEVMKEVVVRQSATLSERAHKHTHTHCESPRNSYYLRLVYKDRRRIWDYTRTILKRNVLGNCKL